MTRQDGVIPPPLEYQSLPSTLEAKRRRMSAVRYPDAPAEGRCSRCNALCEVRTVDLQVPDLAELLERREHPDTPVSLLRVEGLWCNACNAFLALSPGVPVPPPDAL